MCSKKNKLSTEESRWNRVSDNIIVSHLIAVPLESHLKTMGLRRAAKTECSGWAKVWLNMWGASLLWKHNSFQFFSLPTHRECCGPTESIKKRPITWYSTPVSFERVSEERNEWAGWDQVCQAHSRCLWKTWRSKCLIRDAFSTVCWPNIK